MNSIYEGMDYESRITACEECLDDNKLSIFFFLIGFLPATTFLASWIVGTFIHNNTQEEEEEACDDSEEEEVLYENEYPLDDAENDNEDMDYNLCYITERTPDGNVFMRYNDVDECYDFWSDKKVIMYKYLETVARKFVTNFRCSELYIDRQKDIEDQIREEKEAKEKEKMAEEDKKEESDSDDDVFAKLKPKQPLKVTKKSKLKEARNANSYRYQGKEVEFIKKMKKKVEEEKKKVGFSDWKQLLHG